jgi:hypothetical protein
MKKARASAGLLLALALGLIARQADADVLFSDFGPGDTFGSTSREITGSSPAAPFTPNNNPAYTFAAAASGSVSQIHVALSVSTGSVVASLWTAAIGCGTGAFAGLCGSLVPTTELGSWNVPSPVSDIATITGIAGVDLTGGTTYFLELSADSNTTVAHWFDNSVGVTGDVYQCGGFNSTITQCLGNANAGTGTTGAFDVLGASSSIPEPTTLALFGVGVGLGLVRRYRTKSPGALARG